MLLLALALLGVGAPVAAAHTSLVSGSPEPGGRVARAPTTLTMRFDDRLDARTAAVRVVAPDGRRADRGSATASGARGLQVPLRRGLREGTYAVAFRITAGDDGHVMVGGYRFSIGRASRSAPLAALYDTVGPGAAAGPARAVARGIRDAALLVAGGVALLLVAVWPRIGGGPAASRGDRALRRTAGWSAGVALPAALVTAAIDRATARGDLGDLASSGSITGLPDLDSGRAALGGAALLAVAIWALLGRGTRGRALRDRVALAALAAALVVVVTRSGHAAADVGRTVLDAIHVLGAAAWLGGIVGVAVVLLVVGPASAPAQRGPAARRLIGAFAPVAAGSVAALAVAGVAQAALSLTGPDDLWTSGYGRLLAAKVLLVGVVGLVAIGHRRRGCPSTETDGSVLRREAPGPRAAWRRLRLEIVGLVGVLVLTAALGGTATPRALAASPALLGADFGGGPRLDGELSATATGDRRLSFSLVGTDGRPFSDLERVDITTAAPGGGPLPDDETVGGHSGGAGLRSGTQPDPPRRLRHALAAGRIRRLPGTATGSYATRLRLDRRGWWRVRVRLVVDLFTAYEQTLTIRVR
ncbi:copper resistance protein CopC [Patulibacter sp. NPDC049589]|uniref:copper resistance CopC/CopD family protein n=1 Tax=Patulibacter sp. NPDC049589 TaxID=3154731 RepID=UPI0034213106